MASNLTTYQIYLMLLGYLTEQGNDAAQTLITMLVELYRRADNKEED